MLSHAFRATIFKPERVYRLEPDALSWRDDRGSGRLSYADVDSVRFYSIPATMLPGQHRCVVRPKRGRPIVIAATHYVRLAVTEDRFATYAPFVQELLTRIAEASPHARVIAGQNWLMWLFWLVILVAGGLLLLGGLIVLATGEFPLQAAPVFVILLAAMPAAWRIVRRGRPRRVHPAAIAAGG